MKHTDNYSKLVAIDELERRELLAAVRAHGGSFSWHDENDNEKEEISAPIILGSWKHSAITEDYYVTLVVAGKQSVEIYGHPVNCSGDILEPITWIAHGQIASIIDAIPATDEVSDVTTDPESLKP